MKEPTVSVLMPVYNGERYIAEAMESVFAQTFRDFELLIVEDGSTDNSLSVIQKFNDERLRVLRNDGNKGLMVTRNRAIQESKGRYLAFLDCDDVALPTRMEKQVAYLEAHPEIGLLGSWVQPIDEEGKNSGEVWQKDASPEEIPSTLFCDNYFSQSSVMIRREVLSVGLYREASVEDYDLWIRIVRVYKTWNLQEVLVRHRIHSTRTTVRQGSMVWDQDKKVLRTQLGFLKIVPTEEELDFHWRILRRWIMSVRDSDFLHRADRWLAGIVEANRVVHAYDERCFERMIAEQWFLNCNSASGIGMWTWKLFRSSSLRRAYRLTKREKTIFLLKCLIGRGLKKESGVRTDREILQGNKDVH